jgi:hypothetical protein
MSTLWYWYIGGIALLLPLIYFYVYGMAALGSVLVGARYLMLGIAGLLLVAIPVELLRRLVNIILAS